MVDFLVRMVTTEVNRSEFRSDIVNATILILLTYKLPRILKDFVDTIRYDSGRPIAKALKAFCIYSRLPTLSNIF